jgi:hypothetical protein
MPQITLDLDRAKSIHGALVWMLTALEANNINMEFGEGNFSDEMKETIEQRDWLTKQIMKAEEPLPESYRHNAPESFRHGSSEPEQV